MRTLSTLAKAVAAQGRWSEISGHNRTHYCGAYWRWGFHEDGVWSALRVSRALGGRGPIAEDGDTEPTMPAIAGAGRDEVPAGSMTSASAIYEGWVTHRRHRPVEHAFRYRIFMPLLDLDELPEVLDPYPLWSARRPAPAWFRRADYLGDESEPLAESALALLAERIGRQPAGPIRLLAHPRYLGVGFNPVSFLFCHRGSGELDSVIAEVTNTPWGERHAYVLDPGLQPAEGDGSIGGAARQADARLAVHGNGPALRVVDDGPRRAATARLSKPGGRRGRLRGHAGTSPSRDRPPADGAAAPHLSSDDNRHPDPHLPPGAPAADQGNPLVRPPAELSMSRSARTAVQSGPGVIDTVARAGIHAVLRAIRAGRLALHETWSGRSFAFGPANAELDGELVVHDPSFYSADRKRRQHRLRRDIRRRVSGTPRTSSACCESPRARSNASTGLRGVPVA